MSRTPLENMTLSKLANSGTITTEVLTAIDTEVSIPLSGANQIFLTAQNTAVKLGLSTGSTVGSDNFVDIASGGSYNRTNVLFTGNLAVSTSVLPTPVVLPNCNGSINSSILTCANASSNFANISIGQVLTAAAGIPANSILINRSSNGANGTIGNLAGSPINLTGNISNGNVTGSGSAIRLEVWRSPV